MNLIADEIIETKDIIEKYKGNSKGKKKQF